MRDLRVESKNLRFQIDAHSKGNPESKILIKEFPPNTVTPQNIQGYLTELKNKGIELDAIVLDYLNLLKIQSAVAAIPIDSDIVSKPGFSSS